MTDKNAARRGNGEPVEIEAKQSNSTDTAHFAQRTPSQESYLTQELRRLVRERKDALGASFPAIDDASGLGDGHCAHILTPHSSTGRREPTVATWGLLLAAVFGRDYRLQCEPGGPLHSLLSRPADHLRQIRVWRETKYFAAMGSRGGKAAAAKGEKFLKKRARRAAKARWQRHRIKSKES